ncbi:hypothetical protein OG444_38570 [Streptomyces sp. NBC_01232]|uniref:fibronectin type III domain-containing protein n=1 Tax=Streptomyces sp. NBC_01232 TaxID=2903786 RepID=UPI002E102A23|nr:hypothetical protein OG444_38570 [Streptomyces sp. NBC_01232]
MTTRTRLTALATTAVLATTSGVLVSAPTAVAVGLESPADAPSAPSASAKTPKARGANPGWTNPLARPAQPTGLRGSYDGVVNQASLWWTASKETNLAGYRVYRRLDTTDWSQVSGSALLTTPYFVDTPNPTGQTVHYQVRAVSKTGRESEGSLAVSAITADRTAPVAPSGLRISHDFFTATLRWQPVADAAKYEVYAAASAAGPYTLLGTSTGPSYDDYNPPRTTLRYYRVRALDARGNPSAYSAVVTGDGVDRTPPPAPTSLSSYVEATRTHLYWKMSDSFDNDRANGGHFRVYRSPGQTLDPSHLTRVTCVKVGDNGDGLCTDESMAPGSQYTYAVTAVDMTGNESALSAPVTLRSGDRVAPGPVTGLKATPRNDGMLLSWSAPAEDDVTSYVGLRGVRQPDGTIRWLDRCTDEGSDALAMLCADMPDGETNVYVVVAKDRWDNALASSDPQVATVTATELDLRPPVTLPTQGLEMLGMSWSTLVTGEDSPGIYWWCREASLCTGIAGYRVSRWNPSTAAYEPLHTGLLPVTTEKYQDQSGAPGGTYFYTFEALRADGSAVVTHSWGCVRPAFV